MNDSLPFVLGFFVAFIIIMMVTAIKKNNRNFDERQLMARNEAFKGGFIASLSYIAISEVVCIVIGREWITPSCNLAFAVSIPCLVFAIICIVKEAYLSIKQNIKTDVIWCSCISAFNIAMGFSELKDNSFSVFTDNKLDISINIIAGITLLAATIISLIHFVITREKEV